MALDYGETKMTSESIRRSILQQEIKPGFHKHAVPFSFHDINMIQGGEKDKTQTDVYF